MPIKVLITYPHFLVFARPTYLPLKKKLLVIENGDISRWTLIKWSYSYSLDGNQFNGWSYHREIMSQNKENMAAPHDSGLGVRVANGSDIEEMHVED